MAAKNTWAHGKNFFEVCSYRHLFIQLGTLRKVGRSLEVGNCKYVTATLTSSGNDLRGVDFNKALKRKLK